MKKLFAVAVALFLGASSVSASWDYFPVIEQGSAEAKVSYQEGLGLKVRYGLIDNLELFAASGAANCAEYALGARYQILPEMLSAFVDLGIPYTSGGDWGLTPGVQFSTSFTETISLGIGLEVPLHLNHPGAGDNGDDGLSVDLNAGLELDIAFSEQVLFWVGVDFGYDRLTQENREDLEIKSALKPGLGFVFSKDNLSVGTSLGIDLTAKNDDGDDSIGLIGGLDFSIKF